MKIVILAAAGLVLGLGGGAVVGALQVKGRILAEHAQAAADSAAAHAALEPADTAETAPTIELPPPEPADSTLPPERVQAVLDSTGPGASAPAAPTAPQAVPDPSADEPGETPAPGPTAEATPPAALDAEGARKLAKIFGAMKPADAAAVLAEMTDAEVKAVLLQMNDRQAAPILGAFPAARAAALSREVLHVRAGT